MRRFLVLIACLGTVFSLPGAALAGVLAQIDLSSQRMHVYVDGKPTYTWKVSTARPGYRTPTGTYKPYSLARYHRSTIYNGSPMPYSIFFKGGYAIHGTNYVKSLGAPASHGCVRLHTANARELYNLTRAVGPKNMRVVITR